MVTIPMNSPIKRKLNPEQTTEKKKKTLKGASENNKIIQIQTRPSVDLFTFASSWEKQSYWELWFTCSQKNGNPCTSHLGCCQAATVFGMLLCGCLGVIIGCQNVIVGFLTCSEWILVSCYAIAKVV